MSTVKSSRYPTGLAGIVRPTVLAILSASFAFLFYGGWGYWINISHGHETALTVFLAQGSYSFVLTLIMTLLIEALYRVFRGYAATRQWSRARVDWSTILMSCMIVFTGSWLVNVYVGTPEVFKTVVLGFVFGGLYTCAYVLGMSRRQPTLEFSDELASSTSAPN